MKSSSNVRRICGSLASAAVILFALSLAIVGCSVPGGSGTPAPGTTIVYDALPAALPPNMASIGFQATQTAEFGDYVHLAGTNRVLKSVTVTMSDWAMSADYPLLPSAGWAYPITLSLCNVVPGTPLNTVGTMLATVTQTFTIPWRPPADPTSPGGTDWKAGNGLYYNGLAFNITFDFGSQNITLPKDLIICVSYNTQSWGAAPTGVSGPYNSLNVGVEGSTTVGTDDNIDRVFWNTATAAEYADGGAGGVSVFREDTGWGKPASLYAYGTLPVQIKAGP